MKKLSTINYQLSTRRGFTLVEMMVAVALFAVVMTVSIGALLSLIDANRKAQAMQSVMNNLNITLDGMVRSVRMGTDYHCGEVSDPDMHISKDCATSAKSLIAFERFDGEKGDLYDYWEYYLKPDDDHPDIGRIYKETKPNTTRVATPITAKEVDIKEFKVYVKGAQRGDDSQPFVVLVIKGVAGSQATSAFSAFGAKKKIETEFQIQAAASQRILDI